MTLSVILVLQGVCLGSTFLLAHYHKSYYLRVLFEMVILCEHFLLMLHASRAIYQITEGFIVIHPYNHARIILFLLLLFLGSAVCMKEKELFSLSIPAVTILTLPFVEKGAADSYAILLFIVVIFWLLHEINQLFLYHKTLKWTISDFSIKEAIDTMNFGILFYREDSSRDGQILLSNLKMQQLIHDMTGIHIYNGKSFYESLRSDDVLDSCIKSERTSQLVYTLPDKTVWNFDLQHINVKGMPYACLVASDITVSEKITDQLYRRSEELKERNRNIKSMLNNLQSICRAEETVRAKSRVHNVLGQQISLILRSIREQKEPDAALLQTFASGFPDELKNASAYTPYSLNSLVRNFETLGIKVHIQGSLPSLPDLQKTFYDIITEGMTNAVHHGYATKITILLEETATAWTLNLTDNGISKEDPIIEGGGLTGIRAKVDALDGTFSYTTRPHFSIDITIPKGGSL